MFLGGLEVDKHMRFVVLYKNNIFFLLKKIKLSTRQCQWKSMRARYLQTLLSD
jgi:hypothetical protein